MRVTPRQLSGACAALTDALRFEHPADGVLSAYFREQKLLGARDRRFVTETVFGLPGVGNLVVSAVLRRDYPVIQGALLVIAGLYVLINFAIDMLYAVVDPRVKV